MQTGLQLSGVSLRLSGDVAVADVSGIELSGQEQARIGKLRDSAARAALARALKWERLALRQLVWPLVSGEVILEKTETGVPYLAEYPKLSVSISRSDGASMVGVSTAGRVGVDVERMWPIAFEAMLSIVATDAERAHVLTGEGYDRFFRLWTLKEAVLKAMGVGLSGGPKSVCVPAAMIEADGRGVVQTPEGPCEAVVASDGVVVGAVALMH